MPSRGEAVLLALFAALQTLETARRTVLRNVDDPKALPADGLVILHDGEPGEPQELLGGQGPYYYQHVVEIDLFAADLRHDQPAVRDATFDALLTAVAGALDADPTLGGLAEGMSYGAPAPEIERTEGGPGTKRATLEVVVDYQSQTRI